MSLSNLTVNIKMLLDSKITQAKKDYLSYVLANCKNYYSKSDLKRDLKATRGPTSDGIKKISKTTRYEESRLWGLLRGNVPGDILHDVNDETENKLWDNIREARRELREWKKHADKNKPHRG